MEAMDDMTLLREYAARHSETAFETLVSRRIGFVYSAALRQVRDPHLAEEVTQAVFIILGQKAARIPEKTILTGWLFKTTRFTALTQTRTAAKRRQREQEAQLQTEIQHAAPDPLWEQMSPVLDEALASLGESDRQAILLRFFENKDLAEVGNALKSSEDTARKRVTRALEKMRKYFSRRGVVSTSAIIAAGISANSAQAAPVALAKSVTAVAIAKGAVTSASTLTLIKGALKLMAWTKAKTAIVVGVTLILATGTATVAFPKIRRTYLERKVVWVIDSKMLQKQPPLVLIRPAQSIPGIIGGGGHVGGMPSTGGKIIGLKTSVLTMLLLAYRDPADAGGIHTDRVIVSASLPKGEYDFIASTPRFQLEGLRQALKNEFGLVAHRETREMDVLLLKVKNPEVAAGLKLSETTGGYSQGYQGKLSIRGGSLSFVADFVEDSLLQIPVIDRTDLTNLYDIDLTWEVKGRDWTYPTRPVLNRILLEELGLELVPGHEPIEVLVVEKAK